MADFSGVINESIIRKIRRKLYAIICEHVRNFDDENAKAHVERFMEGVSWATGLRYGVRADGMVYVYIGDLFTLAEYEVIDIYIETKILRNSINRHYYKTRVEEVCFNVCN